MKTCETCRYWQPFLDRGKYERDWHWCQAAEFFMIPNPPDVKMKALSNDAQSYSGRLLTHENFGCNQHEYKTKTTHQMACELLALPDVPLVIETWCTEDDKEMVAEIWNLPAVALPMAATLIAFLALPLFRLILITSAAPVTRRVQIWVTSTLICPLATYQRDFLQAA